MCPRVSWFRSLLVLFLLLPLIYLIHQAIKERVDSAKAVFGAEIVSATCKFLTTITFPIFSIGMGKIFQDMSSLWMCIGLVGSVFCLVICYGNPEDCGLSDAFLGLWLGVLVNLERPLEKFVVLIVIGVSMYIAEEVVVQERNAKEVQDLKPCIRRVDYSRSKPATQRQKTFQSIIEEISEEEGHSEHSMEVVDCGVICFVVLDDFLGGLIC